MHRRWCRGLGLVFSFLLVSVSQGSLFCLIDDAKLRLFSPASNYFAVFRSWSLRHSREKCDTCFRPSPKCRSEALFSRRNGARRRHGAKVELHDENAVAVVEHEQLSSLHIGSDLRVSDYADYGSPWQVSTRRGSLTSSSAVRLKPSQTIRVRQKE